MSCRRICLAPMYWHEAYAYSGSLTFSTRGILFLNQCLPLNVLLRIVACYELSLVTNCRLLRIFACNNFLSPGYSGVKVSFIFYCKLSFIFSIFFGSCKLTQGKLSLHVCKKNFIQRI